MRAVPVGGTDAGLAVGAVYARGGCPMSRLDSVSVAAKRPKCAILLSEDFRPRQTCLGAAIQSPCCGWGMRSGGGTGMPARVVSAPRRAAVPLAACTIELMRAVPVGGTDAGLVVRAVCARPCARESSGPDPVGTDPTYPTHGPPMHHLPNTVSPAIAAFRTGPRKLTTRAPMASNCVGGWTRTAAAAR